MKRVPSKTSDHLNIMALSGSKKERRKEKRKLLTDTVFSQDAPSALLLTPTKKKKQNEEEDKKEKEVLRQDFKQETQAIKTLLDLRLLEQIVISKDCFDRKQVSVVYFTLTLHRCRMVAE